MITVEISSVFAELLDSLELDGFNQISSADTVLNKTGFSFSFITDFFARLMNSLRSFLPC